MRCIKTTVLVTFIPKHFNTMKKSFIYSSKSTKMEEMKDNNLVHVIPS